MGLPTLLIAYIRLRELLDTETERRTQPDLARQLALLIRDELFGFSKSARFCTVRR